MLPVAAQGAIVLLSAELTDAAGNPLSPTDLSVSLADAFGTVWAAGLAPVQTSLGEFALAWAVPADATVGKWEATWTGSTAGAVGGTSYFYVIGANSQSVAAQSVIAPSDVASYTAKTLSITDQVFLENLIVGLQGELELYLNRPLTVRNFAERHVMVENQMVVYFRRTPVQSVDLVVVNPDISGGQVLTEYDSYIPMPFGIEFNDPTYELVFRGDADVTAPTLEGTMIEVHYSAGKDGPNEPAIRQTMIRAAAREYLAMAADAQNLSQLRAGEMMNYTFTDSNAGGFTDRELQRLQRFRRRVVA